VLACTFLKLLSAPPFRTHRAIIEMFFARLQRPGPLTTFSASRLQLLNLTVQMAALVHTADWISAFWTSGEGGHARPAIDMPLGAHRHRALKHIEADWALQAFRWALFEDVDVEAHA